MDYWGLLANLATSANATMGMITILSAVLTGDSVIVALFLFLIALNLVIILALKNFSPAFFAQTRYAQYAGATPAGRQAPGRGAQGGGFIGMSLTPLAYPRVHDEELRDFAPEFIRLDLSNENGQIFNGNISRQVLKEFRQAIDSALSAKSQSPSAAKLQKGAASQPAKKGK